MLPVSQDLYRSTSYAPPINLSFNQYLLLSEEPVLFHTGSARQATELLPRLEGVLAGKALSYIFVSHFESDECGGLALLLDRYPSASVICSEVTARQLSGFGVTCNLLVKKPGEHVISGAFDLELISYPSEMHLWEGLLAYEHHRGIFFSSDLMLRWGEAGDALVRSDWREELSKISSEQLPNPERLLKLREDLAGFDPTLIATGHGPILTLR